MRIVERWLDLPGSTRELLEPPPLGFRVAEP